MSSRWKKGQSGNPSGRPKGARHKSTLAAQQLLDGEAEALARKVIELALAGDVTCLRVCLDRLVPPRKDAPIRISLPQVETSADITKASSVILDAVSSGELTPAEGQALCGILEGHRKAIETVDFGRRLTALEEKLSDR